MKNLLERHFPSENMEVRPSLNVTSSIPVNHPYNVNNSRVFLANGKLIIYEIIVIFLSMKGKFLFLVFSKTRKCCNVVCVAQLKLQYAWQEL